MFSAAIPMMRIGFEPPTHGLILTLPDAPTVPSYMTSVPRLIVLPVWLIAR
jgi:hypothetical protein